MLSCHRSFNTAPNGPTCFDLHPARLATRKQVVEQASGNVLVVDPVVAKGLEDGQTRLIEAAKAAGVEHFVYVSFRGNLAIQSPLAEAKRTVERRLKKSGIAYTILQASYFMEIWLTPMLGFDVANGRVKVYGEGKNKISWISYPDVARFAVKALSEQRARNKVIEVGGPEALSPLEVVRAFEAAGSNEIAVEHVPESALREQFETAEDPIQKSFAALMLSYAAGDAIEMTDTLRILPIPLTSVRDYVPQALAQ